MLILDLAMRMIAKDVCIKRPDKLDALYKMSNHTESERNPIRENLLFSSVKRMSYDGLNNLDSSNVTSIVSVRKLALYTHLKINVGKRSSDYFIKYNTTINKN